MIGIGILGYGTVGSNVGAILEERREALETFLGEPYDIRKILVRNKERYPNIADCVTTDICDLLDDEAIHVWIELTGNVSEIFPAVMAAMERGKHVISANKALISAHYDELHRKASECGVHLLYEAAVAAALPVLCQTPYLRTLNEVTEITGVLNGTCNFILGEMEKGKSYAQALKTAQEIGFAEADPSADVDGIDTMRKLNILANRIFGPLKEEEIAVTGITDITPSMIADAQKRNMRLKLVARGVSGGPFTVQVEEVEKDSLFGALEGGENAVTFQTSNANTLTFKGLGAGGRETAYSVLSDLARIYGAEHGIY